MPEDDAAGDSPVAALCRSIKHQLANSEQLIAALKSQLARCQERNRALIQERNDLARSLAQMETYPAELVTQARRRPRDREAEETVHALRQENEALSRRCAELEQTLAERRAELAGASEENACLEEQVSHLQSMVDLLCEHLDLDTDEVEKLFDAD
jgi:chromosome segregation ATPase